MPMKMVDEAPMVDFHHNIFCYYRGFKDEERSRIRQLEDNTTKAFINTLEHGREAVVVPFLEWLGVYTDEKPRFYLQRSMLPDVAVRKKKVRLLLALLPRTVDIPLDAYEKAGPGDSRPDAWILGKDFAVLIESKVLARFDQEQMKLHLTKLFGEDEPPRYREITWADIHRFFLDLCTRLQGLEGWLVQQFAEYLEVIGMNDFCGFRKDFFDYFFVHDDEDARKWVKHNMEVFANNILDELKKTIPFYQYVDLGRIKLSDTYCWAAFGNSKGTYRNLAHQTIAADSQGLNVFVNVELKPAVEKLRNKIRNSHLEWRKIVSELHRHSAFNLKVEERVQKQAQNYDYRSICVVESACLSDPRLADVSYTYVESLLEKIPLPYLTFATKMSRQEAIQASGTNYGRKLIEKITSLMAGFHPLVEFINRS
jgi:hypothetical protein